MMVEVRKGERILEKNVEAGMNDLKSKLREMLRSELDLSDNKINTLSEKILSLLNPEEKEWYKALVENSIDILMIVDELGNIKYISPSIEKIGGYSRDSLLGKNVFIFAHPDEVDYIYSKLLYLLENPGVPETIEFRAKHREGHWVEVEAVGKNLLHTSVRGIVVTMRDISQIKRMEREFRILADYSPFGIYVCGSEGMIYVNKVAEMQTGYSSGELLKMGFDDLLHESRREMFLDHIKNLESGSLVEKIIRKDGSEIWVQINFFNTEWQGDKATFFAVGDITNLKTLEKMLEDRNELMALINSILRHDILNDLTSIFGLLEVYESLRDDTVLEKIKKRILEASKTIKRMKELEVLISEGKGELKPIELKSVVDEIKAKHDVTIELRGNSRILADNAIYSVFDNLIRNAVNHGGTDKIEISCVQCGQFCEIRVADYGKGIPDEIKGRIFDQGTKFGDAGILGLGLYIVKKVIERYGGRIRIEDNNPRGAVFVLELRCA